jgi:hypothetical protein
LLKKKDENVKASGWYLWMIAATVSEPQLQHISMEKDEEYKVTNKPIQISEWPFSF